MSRLWPLLVLASLSCFGCSGEPAKNPDPVEVTGTLKLNGKPLSDVVLNLQPTKGGHPVITKVTDGKFKALITPASYCYYVTEGDKPEGIKAVPKEYREATLDLRDQVTVEPGASTLDIDLE